jgi:hypothetical protein
VRTRTIITARARSGLDVPAIGELMASPKGSNRAYRVLGVATLRTAGDDRCRYRLTLELLREVPDGETIHPWRGSNGPIARDRWADEPAKPHVEYADPMPRPRSREQTRARVVHSGADFGPGLRRRAVRDKAGRLLREPDVEVDEAAVDPRNPNRRVRRAYRVDSVDLLCRAGTIGKREVDAAEELRRHLERIAPPVGGAGVARVSLSIFACQPITDDHIRAARKLREAAEALGDRWWPVVLWVLLGGSVRGYAAQWRVRPASAADLVASGMARLADHLYGRAA